MGVVGVSECMGTQVPSRRPSRPFGMTLWRPLVDPGVQDQCSELCYAPRMSVRNTDAGLVSDRVFATLLEALLSGRYAPGEKLPTQRALAADLGVTMSSLREALKRLEQMGLIEVRHGDAMRVRDWRRTAGSTCSPTCSCAAAGWTPACSATCSRRARSCCASWPGSPRSAARTSRPRRLHELAAEFAAAPDDAGRGARRLRVLHRGRPGRRQPRLPPDPQRDPRAVLRPPRGDPA